MNTPAPVTVKVDRDLDRSTLTVTPTPDGPVLPAGSPVTVTLPDYGRHLDPDRAGVTVTVTGLVLRTWLDRDRDRWYEVSADDTGLTVTAPAVVVSFRPGATVEVDASGLGDCPVIFEVDQKLPAGNWRSVAADFAATTDYTPAALDTLADRIARYYATVYENPVRVAVHRPGDPAVYGYATANPPASGDPAGYRDVEHGVPALAA